MTDLSPLLRIRDAHVRRAGREILAVDEFSLAEGESAALLGPNGSGEVDLHRPHYPRDTPAAPR